MVSFQGSQQCQIVLFVSGKGSTLKEFAHVGANSFLFRRGLFYKKASHKSRLSGQKWREIYQVYSYTLSASLFLQCSYVLTNVPG